MKIFPFQAVYPDLDFISSTDSFFDTVRENYSQYRQNEFFQKAPSESIYIYRISSGNRSYLGLITCVDIRDYLDQHILKHENTLASKEQQQTQLLLQRKAMVKPVLLTYEDVADINRFLERFAAENAPFFTTFFEEEKATHQFWQINAGNQIQYLQQQFAEKVSLSYIADGHHRSSAVAMMYQRFQARKKANPFERLLCAFFPASQLKIQEYNRLVCGLNDFSPTRFMAQLSDICRIRLLREIRPPKKAFEMVLHLDKNWYQLRWKKNVLKKYSDGDLLLDVRLLNEEIFKSLLGITDLRVDTRIQYLEGNLSQNEIKARAGQAEVQMAFLLYPIAFRDFISLSRKGEVLPPKSTWFEPRVKNGLMVMEL